MAMLPFCGYNMGDYFAHWLRVGAGLTRPPAIFHVNWFRTGADGRFLWPGFGQNVRVLLWMVERLRGKGGARETPIGLVPDAKALPWDDLPLSAADRAALLRVDAGEWAAEAAEIGAFFDGFGPRLPESLRRSLGTLAAECQGRLQAAEA
jgi:phosphoenolpyruvate carboxykinase (GTP)